ncbi:M20/M25/M40 family metallo-hydrolase [Pseudoalteromonas sp. CST5]|uniref:M20/M25/M40 family metallo-hydrolase n=1 Tax=unclassified Pseudoalteromonas TaxID=194690 RepID=UPI002359FCE0|nr:MULTISPECIES: M20/M25/M40 family metallo-hydrolase [unclassified Pseudoalteromonas]MDC9512313.1 M20/M25/M40 family metallo-hydrolase [Pseudoalteromonas sp. CST1]MDC9536549.1 M20/M25/M40 family metallo-hydrolase [Pseudoalteromonas sp. CST3]MDC9540917.1 M20/M25/M40 family metallo-hydrolase [Pseudoalteromonas sp. CST2]MDC9544110.1 M20/M25/M40 family metallo-hydrolase [Pseudoalteromonas sp. CST4]MDC9548820.1 M20/M25/M40 family metallo-hydrolase [Pseudoalteromonas sp. CST5]
MKPFKLLSALSLFTTMGVVAQSETNKVWVSIDSTAAAHYEYTQHGLVQRLPFAQRSTSALENIDLVNIPADQVNNLSEFMHHNYNRCGGFVAHDSWQEASSYVTQLAAAHTTQNTLAFSYSIDNEQTVQNLMSSISTVNLDSTVNSLTSFNNRYYTSQTGIDAANWLNTYWQQIAQSRSDISIATYPHNWAQSSVIVTIEGNEKADEIVIIGGHLDSINQSNPSNGRSPGADDNASGIAVLSEALRAIVQTNYKPQRTIQIMAFAAEEVGLRGSSDIASSYQSQGKNVVGMVQFDMTGNNGSLEDIVMMTDYTNNAQNQFLAALLDTYLPQLNYGFDQCGYGCSDHASWYQQGFAASMPFESKMGDINPLIHTQIDNQFDAQHASKFAKLAVSYIAEMAKNAGDTLPPTNNQLTNGQTLSGITGVAKEQFIYTLAVPQSASNLNFITTGGTGDADLYIRYNQAPTLNDYDCKSTTSSSNERCDINPSSEGVYYVMVHAWNAIENVSLTGSYNEGGSIEPINRSITNISVSAGSWQRFSQSLNTQYASLDITMSGGSGDADLYVNFGTPSSDSQYLCRPYKNGNSETCSFSAPQTGNWYIDLKGYSNASNVTLSINAQ